MCHKRIRFISLTKATSRGYDLVIFQNGTSFTSESSKCNSSFFLYLLAILPLSSYIPSRSIPPNFDRLFYFIVFWRIAKRFKEVIYTLIHWKFLQGRWVKPTEVILLKQDMPWYRGDRIVSKIIYRIRAKRCKCGQYVYHYIQECSVDIKDEDVLETSKQQADCLFQSACCFLSRCRLIM